MNSSCDFDADCPGNLICYPASVTHHGVSFCDCNAFWGYVRYEPFHANLTENCSDLGPQSYLHLVSAAFFIIIAASFLGIGIFDFFTNEEMRLSRQRGIKGWIISHTTLTWTFVMMYFVDLILWRIVTIHSMLHPSAVVITKQGLKRTALNDLELILITFLCAFYLLALPNVAFVWIQVSYVTQTISKDFRLYRTKSTLRALQAIGITAALALVLSNHPEYSGLVNMPLYIIMLIMFIIGRVYFIKILEQSSTTLQKGSDDPIAEIVALIRCVSALCILSICLKCITLTIMISISFKGPLKYCDLGGLCFFMVNRELFTVASLIGIAAIFAYVRKLPIRKQTKKLYSKP